MSDYAVVSGRRFTRVTEHRFVSSFLHDGVRWPRMVFPKPWVGQAFIKHPTPDGVDTAKELLITLHAGVVL